MTPSYQIDTDNIIRITAQAPTTWDPTLKIIHKLEHQAQESYGIRTIDFPAWQARTKRILDLAGALFILALSAPLILITAGLIRLTSKGPIIFKQKRVGRGGKIFTIYKFRSMYQTAEQELHLIQHKNEVSGPVFKIKKDPRLTWVGKIIRKTSIDEIPQLINVIKGEMSLVGPRPPIPTEVMKYKPEYLKRLAVKPGLTCIWQVSGRSHIPFEQWMQLDCEYVDNWSLGLDIKILLQTIPAVILGDGAH